MTGREARKNKTRCLFRKSGVRYCNLRRQKILATLVCCCILVCLKLSNIRCCVSLGIIFCRSCSSQSLGSKPLFQGPSSAFSAISFQLQPGRKHFIADTILNQHVGSIRQSWREQRKLPPPGSLNRVWSGQWGFCKGIIVCISRSFESPTQQPGKHRCNWANNRPAFSISMNHSLERKWGRSNS